MNASRTASATASARARIRELGSMPPALAVARPPVRRLWVIGRDPDPLRPCVAIVGARRPTPYGTDVAFALAADLAATGLCVVSGLALGIDAAAHEGALSAGGRTIAVLGSGLDRVYPAANRDLFERIVASGCVLSEYPSGTRALKRHFPARNRIIAALALGVVVVQAAAEKAGGMITARLAADFGREVFAVPGDIRSELSRGPHALIADGARLCASAGDVVDGLRAELAWATPLGDGAPVPNGVEGSERALLRALSTGPARADDLAQRTNLTVADTTRALVRLEIAGFVQSAGGGTFRRVR